MMDSIIAEVEADPHYRKATDAAHPDPEATISDVICTSPRQAASILPVKAIVTYTTSGWTTLRAARERPAAPILALTPDIKTARALDAGLGHLPDPDPAAEMLSEIVEYACATATAKKHAMPGDTIAIAAGMPFGVAGTTNLLRIARLPEGHDPDPAYPRSRDLR